MFIVMTGVFVCFFQAEDGIRDAQESRGLGDVYKRQVEKVQELVATSSFNLIETLAKYIYENLIDAKINLSLIHI